MRPPGEQARAGAASSRHNEQHSQQRRGGLRGYDDHHGAVLRRGVDRVLRQTCQGSRCRLCKFVLFVCQPRSERASSSESQLPGLSQEVRRDFLRPVRERICHADCYVSIPVASLDYFVKILLNNFDYIHCYECINSNLFLIL